MRDLTMIDFSETLGESFEVEAGESRLPLKLDRVEELRASGRPGGSFRLEFLGPLEPVLPQSIYPFERGGERFDIFIVPIAKEAGGMRYEAVFF